MKIPKFRKDTRHCPLETRVKMCVHTCRCVKAQGKELMDIEAVIMGERSMTKG